MNQWHEHDMTNGWFDMMASKLGSEHTAVEGVGATAFCFIG